MKTNNPPSWIIIYAITLHVIWGIVLLISPLPLGITAIASLVKLGITSAHAAGYFYLTIAFLATMGLVAPSPANFFFLLPQQIVLLLSALGAGQAMISGTFADGVIRSSVFLIADQAPVIIAAILHTLAIYTNFLRWTNS